MTNLEALQSAKTKEDFEKIFFEFETEVNFRKGAVRVADWLDEERNTAKDTALKVFTILFREGKND